MGWESGRYFGASWEPFGLADGGGDGLEDVTCNLQPARYERQRKMSMRAMTAMITGTRGG